MKTGIVFCTDAKASARPEPNTLSAGAPLIAAALPTISPRSIVRAVALSGAPLAPAMRHGADCSTSAASPATCGAAADVPKNVLTNRPAPVTLTPSIAEMSGFWRPSIVGPRLLKNSMVEFVRSVHDSLVPLKVDTADADAEQIAPTEITLAGEPPASPCAATLRDAVL